jgi:hypothetical protein
MPDILVFYDSRAMGLELKSEPGKLSKQQREMFAKLEEAGIHTFVCRSLEEVHDALVTQGVPARGVSFDGHTKAKARCPAQSDAGTAQA